MAQNYHLTYNSEKEGWDIKREGASRPSDHFSGHGKALARARELALNSNVNLILHDETGAITGSQTPEEIGKSFLTKAADKVQGAIGAVTSAVRG